MGVKHEKGYRTIGSNPYNYARPGRHGIWTEQCEPEPGNAAGNQRGYGLAEHREAQREYGDGSGTQESTGNRSNSGPEYSGLQDGKRCIQLDR